MSTMPGKPNEKKPEIDITNPPRTDSREAEMGLNKTASSQAGHRSDRQSGSDASSKSSCDCPANGSGTPRNIDENKPGGLPIPSDKAATGIDAAVGDGVSHANARDAQLD